MLIISKNVKKSFFFFSILHWLTKKLFINLKIRKNEKIIF
jgi:hypothetical protein